MNANDAIVLARSLMTEHGVGYLQFGFHSYPERMGIVGRAHYIHNGPVKIWSKITLSSDWIRILPESKIEETILHEIAHTLTNPMLEAHGPEWVENCHKVGIFPSAKFMWNGPVPWEKDYLDPRNPSKKVSDNGQILCER